MTPGDGTVVKSLARFMYGCFKKLKVQVSMARVLHWRVLAHWDRLF